MSRFWVVWEVIWSGRRMGWPVAKRESCHRGTTRHWGVDMNKYNGGHKMSTYLSNLLITTHLVWLKADIWSTLLNILWILSEILRLIFVSLRNGIQINASFRAYGATWQNKIFFIVPSVKTLKCHIHIFVHIFTFICFITFYSLLFTWKTYRPTLPTSKVLITKAWWVTTLLNLIRHVF